MERKIDLTEELGLEFKIDDFIRRHMSDIELPTAVKGGREDLKRPVVQPFKPEARRGSGERRAMTKEEQENEDRVEEPKITDLERYRVPLAPLLPHPPKQLQKHPDVIVSVPVSVASSALPSPSIRLEATMPISPAPFVEPKVKKYDPFELPDAPPFLFVLGNGGMMACVRNRESDYSHNITLGNVRTHIREIPQIQNLHYFPGPIDSSTSIPILFKYCNERAKDSYLWEVLKLQLTIPCSLFETMQGAEEQVKGALTGTIQRLRSLPRTNRNPYNPYYASVPGAEVAQENADLLREGKLEEALSHALATRLWPQAFYVAGLMGGDAAFKKTVAAYSSQVFNRSDSLYVLGMLVSGNLGNLLVTQDASEDWAENVATVLSNLSLVGTDAALKFLKSLADMLDFRREAEPAAVCKVLLRSQPSDLIRVKSVIDSLQITEVLQFLTGGNHPHLLCTYFVHAVLLAEVGLVEKAQSYLAKLNALRIGLVSYKPDIAFVSYIRYFSEQLASLKPWKPAKPAEAEKPIIDFPRSEYVRTGEKKHSRDFSFTRSK